MYSDVVMEVPKSYFEKIIDEMKEAKGVHFDTELTADDLKELSRQVQSRLQRGYERGRVPAGSQGAVNGALLRLYSVPGTTRVPSYTVV